MPIKIFVMTAAAFALVACASAPDAPMELGGPPPKFVIYKDGRNECRWKLESSNGETIAQSSESYRSKKACDRSIEITRRANEATIEDKR